MSKKSMAGRIGGLIGGVKGLRTTLARRGCTDIAPTQAHAAAKHGFFRQADYVASVFWGLRRTAANKAGEETLAAECRARSKHHGEQKLPGNLTTTYPDRDPADLEDWGTYDRAKHSVALWAEYEALAQAAAV